ncbi:sugar phosphate isomerase/epimerase family protein [Arthrobacter bambusae]|uniref:sugar phosphate isomerase/epimerase family protein n=1 Tax=Arthrobacter bambusae TaxID=1338426 RepID=UPI002780C7D6|nr:sugar phosphate isomerase/epimerase family protein [Arthrobacter bambusae]MDQ0239528.1 sugar phosphate isomerase/epimerase [Arthrobacter bambusae]
MKLGIDGLKFPDARKLGPLGILTKAHDAGLSGVFFRTILDLSPTLDTGELRRAQDTADEYGMYLEAGLGKVNPYALPETPEIRAIGDGDTVLGFRRMMEASATIDCRELWVATASHKPYPGRFAYDRFRSDISWTDQLIAIEKLLMKLAPIARDLGIHLNLETHEEITSFELVRLVEAVGPDVTGITFDTANVLQRAEHPVWAAKRVAPYVRQTHIKDAGLFRDPEGLLFQMRPNGGGMVNLEHILPILADANPDVNLSLEIRQVPSNPARPSPTRSLISIHDPHWIDGHPDLTAEELLAFMHLVQQFEQRLESGEIPTHAAYGAAPFGVEEAWNYITESVQYVQDAAATTGVALTTAAGAL